LAELRARSEYEQRLIGIVSHDLRNPIGSIVLAAGAALDEHGLPPYERTLMERIARSANRAGRLISDLLAFSQTRLGSTIPINPAAANLRQIVEQIVDELQALAPSRTVQVSHSGEE